MGRNDGHVSHVGGQMCQFALHIDPLPIPAIQGRDGKAVSQIMQARRPPALIQDTDCQAQQLPIIHKAMWAVCGLLTAALAVRQQRSASGCSGPRRSAR